MKPIPGMNGYFASEDGQIFSTRNHGQLHRMSVLTRNGYEHVSLRKDGKSISLRVHRLIAMTWCQGYDPKLTVNHKDCDKTNNHASNLEWVTVGENIRHSVRMGRRRYITTVDGFGRRVWREKNGIRIQSESIRDASREIGVEPDRGGPNIHAALNSEKRKTAYGFVWGYAVGYSPVCSGSP